MWEVMLRLRRFPLSAGRRMLMTIEWVDLIAVPKCNSCKYCSIRTQRDGIDRNIAFPAGRPTSRLHSGPLSSGLL